MLQCNKKESDLEKCLIVTKYKRKRDRGWNCQRIIVTKSVDFPTKATGRNFQLIRPPFTNSRYDTDKQVERKKVEQTEKKTNKQIQDSIIAKSIQ